MVSCPKYRAQNCMFSQYLEQNTPGLPVRRRPPGAAAPGIGGIVSKCVDIQLLFQNVLKQGPPIAF